MPEIGQSLSHYSLEEKIGKGGMGEVFRAKDQKLGRDVAIKVLPEEFAKDVDHVARFQREAKLLASLNHPNIAAIHGLEESEGIHFLVLELIEGDTLADRIKHGAIPIEESLKLALQIAEALEAAHEKSVIHRDLKPSNIKITPEGKIKVLDFGLAKAFEGYQEDMILSDSPTISAAATQKGVILGTAAYMSPEQAKGKPVDKRADIWAFGAVLYEMLTGQAAFKGDEVSEILASVIKGDINLELLPANIHPRVQEMISRCLRKDLKDRYRDVGDVQFEIKQVLADPSGVFIQPVAAVAPRTRIIAILPWVAAAVILTAIIAGVVVWNLRAPEPQQIMRFSYELPEGLQASDLSGLAISPDGKKFVYGTTKGFYIRSVDELEARLISESDENPTSLFFSPDGQWIGYLSQADGKLKKIAISGGAPVVLCDAGGRVSGAKWYADNTIVYGQPPRGIMRVSASGGTPETLTKSGPETPKELDLPLNPQVLPDGKTLLYTSIFQLDPIKAKIMLQSLESGERRELFEGAGAEYLPTGHIVYLLGLETGDLSIFAIPFDLDSLEVTGSPVSMLEGITGGLFSKSGTLAYISRTAITTETESVAGSGRTLVWVDREGKEEAIQAPPHIYRYPDISPDGTRVCLTAQVRGNEDIWIWDFAKENLTRLTFDESRDGVGIWTHDGQRIAFRSMREEAILKEAPTGIFWKKADGTGDAEFLGSLADKYLSPLSWSGDGSNMVVTVMNFNASELNIQILSMEEDHQWGSLLEEEFSEANAQISPDGRWMAYQSDETGQAEVYVRPFPNVDEGRWQVSADGGNGPRWSPDGQELFYLIGRERTEAVMRVRLETESTFKPAKPESLFDGTYVGYYPMDGIPYDIHPDGKQFLMMKPPETITGESSAEEPLKINIITNWFEELKQRVPIP